MINIPQLLPKVRNWLIIFLSIFLVLLSIWLGARSGTRLSQARLAYQNGLQIQRGMEYFYSDQDRYPAATEFADRNTMLWYFNDFPPFQLATPQCPESFRYQRDSLNYFRLSVCLPARYENMKAGWNQVIKKQE